MRYFIGLLITLGLFILLLVLIITGGSKPGPKSKNLVDYASTDAQVSMTIDGPVNADSLHEQVRVTVDSTNVAYEHIKGYQNNVVDTKLFANNENAYDAFLHALQHAGFTQGDKRPELGGDSGWCATGDRYIFELTQDGKTLERYWDTSCGNPKTYLGNTELTLTLFQAQVPGYVDLTQNIQF